MSLLEVDDLKIEFLTEEGLLRAVDGVSFSVEQGRTLGIVGESGCGKSVTALSLMRLLREPPARIASGAIRFRGQDILKIPREELRRFRGAEMGMIFQEPMTSLNPVYTIGHQVAEAMRTHFPDLSRDEVKKRAIRMLTLVGIPEPEHRYDDYPHELSGGQRQRVMIAMALSCEPKLLIADEPTTALDVTIQAQILELIGRLQREMGMSVILITHDLGIVAETTDDVMVMYAGKAVEKGTCEDIFRDPLHPYTLGLLASVPAIRGADKSTRLQGIPGVVPNLKRLPPGCRFQDRCRFVKPHCRDAEPPLEEKAPGHFVACFEAVTRG